MAPRKKKKDDAPGMGHNSQAAAADELRSGIERIERLMEEKKTVQDDIKDVFGELKGRGYDTRAVKQIIKERAADKAQMDEIEGIVQTYRNALGMRAPGDGLDYHDSEDEDETDTESSDDADEMV